MTLDTDNILWLQGRARAGKERSLSEALDTVVSSARRGEYGYRTEARSVVGTVDIAASDPALLSADAALRPALERWLGRQDGLDARPAPPKVRTRKVAARG